MMLPTNEESLEANSEQMSYGDIDITFTKSLLSFSAKDRQFLLSMNTYFGEKYFVKKNELLEFQILYKKYIEQRTNTLT